NVAGRVEHAGDPAHGSVRVRRISFGPGRRPVCARVTEEHLAVSLEVLQGRVVGVVAALAMGHGHPQRVMVRDGTREGRVEALRGDLDLATDEPQRAVAKKRAWHQAGLGEDLESVANAE